MQTPAFPENELQRLQALHDRALLDTPPEERFDRLTRLAKQMFGCQMALVSLVDAKRQWFKSRQGLEACETGRDISFCGHAILNEDIFHIPDASLDLRFADNPLVSGAPHIRFYAGAPLSTVDGYRVGTLCIIDAKPRQLTAQELNNLRDLADCVEAEINQVELQQQKQALNQFKSTLDRTLDCVFMFDADTLLFFYMNEGALRQVGYGREELLRMHPYDIKPAFTAAQFQEMLAPMLSGQQASLTFETVHRHKSGRDIPVEVFLQYFNWHGERPRFVAIVRDISERKRIDNMKNEFVSIVSHELRTPLTSISGALGLIAGGALGVMPEKAQQMISIAHRNSLRLSFLINDLLDMEKLVAGKMHFDLQAQALLPLIEQAIEANRGYGAERRVSIALRHTAADPLVQVDSQRLMQVLANLLSNAIKYSLENGQVEVAMALQDRAVRVTVSDHGLGIPAEFRERIFQKFSQADSSDTRQKGGTGLGLAITRELVQRMGGSIGFESEEGKGSSFFFELPLCDRVRVAAGEVTETVHS